MELPRFVAVRQRVVYATKYESTLNGIEREQVECHADNEEDDELDVEDELHKGDELILESTAAAAERPRQFAAVNESLAAAELGTS
jgi:hypothetical protein